MKRRWIVALASPAIFFAGCDSIPRFTRGGSTVGAEAPPLASSTPSIPAAADPAEQFPPAGSAATASVTSQSGGQLTPTPGVGVVASLSDREPPASNTATSGSGPSDTNASGRADGGRPASTGVASNAPAHDGGFRGLASTGPSRSTGPSSSASGGTPAAQSPPDVQLASATSISSAARRTFDAVLASLPSPNSKAGANEKLTQAIAAFPPFPFAFDLPTVDGSSLASGQTGYQLMVVDIWATWCGPCRKAIPDFVAIQQRYASRGVQVVGITCDSVEPGQAGDVRRKAAEIGQRLRVNYPLLLDDGSTIDQVPDFRGYPTTLFLTPEGQVVYKVTGMQTEEQLAAILDLLLPAP